TLVAAGSRCTSACFIVFAAGGGKIASYDAAVGVHGGSDKIGHENAQTQEATRAMGRIARGVGGPARILRHMVAKHAPDIARLAPDDRRARGTIMTDRPARPSPPASPDDRWLAGIDIQAEERKTTPQQTGQSSSKAAGKSGRNTMPWQRR